LIDILFSDNDLVAINKPPALAVHEAPGKGSSVLRELREQHGLNDLTLVHRLDKDASGVLLLAKSKKIASEIQNRWSEVEKTYLAICNGAPPEESGVIDAPILENQTGKPERLASALRYYKEQNPGVEIPTLPEPKTSAVHPAGRPAQTEYRAIEPLRNAYGLFSLLEVKPRQGRMHQIRVHLKHIGCGLMFDSLYGSMLGPTFMFEDKPRMPLHASRLSIPDPRDEKKRIMIDAPLPKDFSELLNALK
jgi:23S rRNA-/tRNA-specific pseudouridylate synthase